MHYKNGRPVALGDQIVGRWNNGQLISGVVVQKCEGATSCNLTLQPIVPALQIQCVTAGDWLHIDDAIPTPPPINQAT